MQKSVNMEIAIFFIGYLKVANTLPYNPKNAVKFDEQTDADVFYQKLRTWSLAVTYHFPVISPFTTVKAQGYLATVGQMWTGAA